MISINFEDGKFFIKILGSDNFSDIVSELHECSATFNSKTSSWVLHYSKWKSFKESLIMMDEDYEVDVLSEKNLIKYENELSELKIKKNRFSVDYSNLTFPPLVGKHPNEKYQSEDIRKALGQNRFLFNWEMGLGKSYCLAVLLENLFANGEIDRALICTSGVGSMNLKNELLLHCKSFKEDDIKTFTNAKVFKKKEQRAIFDSDPKIIVASHDILKLVMDYYNTRNKNKSKNYRKCPYDFTKWGNTRGLFIDECHFISNPSSRRTEIFLQLIDFFEYRYLFTGTLADKYEKLYVPCKILDRKLVDDAPFKLWLSNHVQLGNRFSSYGINSDMWDLDKIQNLSAKLIHSYGAKRLIKDCLDLPPNFEKTFTVEMSEKHRRIYELFSNESMTIISKLAKQGEFTNTIINKMLYFQSIVDNPALLENSKYFEYFSAELKKLIKDFNYSKHYEKLTFLDSIIEEKIDLCGQKGIIWYFHPKTKECLIDHYKEYNPFVIESGMGYELIFKYIDDFKKSKTSKLLITSVNIMNTSLTVTEAKWQVYLENTFKYQDYQQSRGRIFRPGQQDPVTTYFLVYKSSIDGFQMDNLKNKGHTLDTLMNMQYISPNVWKTIFNFNNGDKI